MADRIAFAAPGSLDTLTGGFVYDRRIVDGLRGRGWVVDVLDLGPGYPLADGEAKARALGLMRSAARGCPIVVDGLALGALPEAAECLARERMLIGLVHHPLYLEKGLAAHDRQILFESEGAALAHAARIVTTSRETSRRVAEAFGYPPEQISIVEPGVERPTTAACHRPGPHIAILSVGPMVPRKGHLELVEALAPLAHLSWTLTIVGALDRNPDYSARVRTRIGELDLAERIRLAGVINTGQLEGLYAESDVFALASEFEGYGMAYAEAVVRGLPVIGTTGGAIATTVPEGAGILVPPGDTAALRSALAEVLSQSDVRRSLAERARASGAHFPTWGQAVGRFASVLEGVA